MHANFLCKSVSRPKRSSQVRNYISHKKDPCSGVILSRDKIGHSLNWIEYLPLNFNTSLVVVDWNGEKYHLEPISVFVVMLYKPWQSRPKTTILYLKRKMTILCFSCYNLDLMGFLLQEWWSSVWRNWRCLPSWLRRASWFCCWYSPESSEVCKDSFLTVSLCVALFTLFDVNRVDVILPNFMHSSRAFSMFVTHCGLQSFWILWNCEAFTIFFLGNTRIFIVVYLFHCNILGPS